MWYRVGLVKPLDKGCIYRTSKSYHFLIYTIIRKITGLKKYIEILHNSENYPNIGSTNVFSSVTLKKKKNKKRSVVEFG